MALGVASGSAVGIPPVEALDVQRFLLPYLTPTGPRWDIQRVAVNDGREVLLIVVDPPKWGQTPFPCCKEGVGLRNGDIYVRADGETRQATGVEFVQLQGRAQRAEADVALEVSIEGVARAYHCSDAALAEFLDRERERLLAAIWPKPSAYPLNASAVIGAPCLATGYEYSGEAKRRGVRGRDRLVGVRRSRGVGRRA
jgi:hypothetical protein